MGPVGHEKKKEETCFYYIIDFFVTSLTKAIFFRLACWHLDGQRRLVQ